MSGTSADGIDAALVSFEQDGSFELLRTEFTPFTQETQREINVIATLGRKMELAEIRQRDPINAAIDRSDVHTLLQLYRKADDAAPRERAAGGIFKVGGPGPVRLIRLVETEYKNYLREYRKLFQKQVMVAIKEKRGGKDSRRPVH